MLVLSRRVGESIVIGDNVTVTVLEIHGDVVRVGVDAPREVKVHRQELLAELADTNRAAASPSPESVAESIAGLSRIVPERPESGRPTRRTDDPEQPRES
jgi:carbon storage regulator